MISIQEMAKLVCGRPLTEDEMITNGFYTCFGKNIISSKYGMYWGNIESTLDTNSLKKKFCNQNGIVLDNKYRKSTGTLGFELSNNRGIDQIKEALIVLQTKLINLEDNYYNYITISNLTDLSKKEIEKFGYKTSPFCSSTNIYTRGFNDASISEEEKEIFKGCLTAKDASNFGQFMADLIYLSFFAAIKTEKKYDYIIIKRFPKRKDKERILSIIDSLGAEVSNLTNDINEDVLFIDLRKFCLDRDTILRIASQNKTDFSNVSQQERNVNPNTEDNELSEYEG